uniref:Uncharacterized protein n=1 Tax=Hyaloperonospora arabidopsidis (strain Emoy2) TaxID=559515 RepID=M4BY74_HYAAE
MARAIRSCDECESGAMQSGNTPFKVQASERVYIIGWKQASGKSEKELAVCAQVTALRIFGGTCDRDLKRNERRSFQEERNGGRKEGRRANRRRSSDARGQCSVQQNASRKKDGAFGPFTRSHT